MYGEPKNYALRGKVLTTGLISKKAKLFWLCGFYSTDKKWDMSNLWILLTIPTFAKFGEKDSSQNTNMRNQN